MGIALDIDLPSAYTSYFGKLSNEDGRANYPCERKWGELIQEASLCFGYAKRMSFRIEYRVVQADGVPW